MKGLLQEPLGNGRVRCNLCAWNCTLTEGAVGICRVRKNEGGEIDYFGGASMSAMCPLVGKCGAGTACIGAPPGSPAGCSWSCSFCSSAVTTLPELAPIITPKEAERQGLEPWPESKPVPLTRDNFLKVKARRALNMNTPAPSTEEILEAWRSSGQPGFAVRSTEPFIHLDSLLPVFRGVRAEGGFVAIGTNAFATPESVRLVAPHVDQVEIGVKGSMNPEFLKKVAGVPRVQPVWDTMRTLAAYEHIDIVVSDVPVLHDGWKADLDKLVGFVAEHVPARDYPRLIIRPWAGNVPFAAFGPYQAAAPYMGGTSRVLLVGWATRLALTKLEMVWVEGLTTREQTGLEEVLHEFEIVREGKLQRVARNAGALGAVLEVKELDLDPEEVVEAARIRMRQDTVPAGS